MSKENRMTGGGTMAEQPADSIQEDLGKCHKDAAGPTVDELQAKLDLANEKIERLTLAGVVQRLSDQIAQANTPPHVAMQRAMASFVEAQADAQQKARASLLAGPRRFKIEHDGDPTEIVGGTDMFEARQKYRKFFGIIQSGHEEQINEYPMDAPTNIVTKRATAEVPEGSVPAAVRP
jgi:hypothetical protein